MDIGLKKTLQTSFATASTKVREALETEGFGILTEIDVQQVLKKKIGAELRPYTILGACNPPLAHHAISAEPDAGVMLPCNVVVRESGDGEVTVTAVDPMQTLARDSPALHTVAKEVRDKLVRVMERLS